MSKNTAEQPKRHDGFLSTVKDVLTDTARDVASVYGIGIDSSETSTVLQKPSSTLTIRRKPHNFVAHLLKHPVSGEPAETTVDREAHPFFLSHATKTDLSQITKEIIPLLDGTNTRLDEVKVEAKRVKKGKAGKVKLRGWKRGVQHQLDKQKNEGNKLLEKTIIPPTRRSAREGKNDQQALLKAQGKRKPSRTARGIANTFLGTGARSAELMLEVGRDEFEVERDIMDLVGRLQDGPLDPFDLIHGIGDTVVKVIQTLQSGISGALLREYIAKYPLLEKAITYTVALDKWTSRDEFNTKLVGTLYDGLYDDVLKNLKRRFKFVATWLIPSQGDEEAGLDYVMTARDLARLQGIEEVLSLDPNGLNPLTRKHQEVVARAYVNVLDKHSQIHHGPHLFTELENEVIKIAEEIANEVPVFGSKLKEVLSESLGRKEFSEEEEVLRQTQNVRDYTTHLFQIADKHDKEDTNINQAERALWHIAGKTSTKVLSTYNLAQKILEPATK